MTSNEAFFPPPPPISMWRSKKVLVTTKQATLPDRCVKCNTPTQNKLKRNLRWHHPALYALIVGGVLFYVLLALVFSKTATLNVGYCETHTAARKRAILIAWVLVLLSFGIFYFAVTLEDLRLFFFGVIVFFAGFIYGLVKARVVAPQKIDDHYVWLIGVNAQYLEEFPEWHNAR